MRDSVKRLRTLARTASRFAAAVVASAATLLLVAGVWVVVSGPVSIPFLTAFVEDALVFEDLGVRVRMRDTVLAWGGWRRNLDLRAVDVRFVDDAGTTVASVPELAVRLSGAALLRGEFAPTRIALLRPEFRVVREVDGGLSLAGFEIGDQSAGPVVQTLLAALSASAGRRGLAGSIDHIAIIGGVASLEDRGVGTVWRMPQVDAAVQRTDDGLAGDIDLRIDADGELVRLAVAAEYASATGILTLGTAFTHLIPSRFATAFTGALARFRGVDMPVSGTVTAVIEPGGAVSKVDYDLAAGAGILDLPEVWHRPQPFEQITVRGSWNGASSTLRFDDAFAESGMTTGHAAGFLTLDSKEGVGITLDASWQGVAASDLAETWPWQLAPNVRRWVIARVHAGVVREGSLRMRVPPGGLRDLRLERDELDMRYAFEAVTGTILEGQPDIRDARGMAHLTGASFDLTVEEGALGGLEIGEGSLHIDGLDTPLQSAVIEVQATGAASEFGRLFALPPLSVEDLPADLEGMVAARAHFDMPVQENVGLADVKFAAAANLRGFGVGALAEGIRVSDGALTVRADANEIEAEGVADVNGVPMRVAARHRLGGGDTPTRLDLEGVLRDEDLDAFGLGTDRVRGTLPFTATLAGDGWRAARMDVALDLEAASVRMPLPLWDKSAGEPGTAAARVAVRDDGVFEVPALSVSTAALQLTAQGVFDAAQGRAAGAATVNGVDVDAEWEAASGPDGGSRITLGATLGGAARAELGFPTDAWITGPVHTVAVLEADGLGIGPAEVSMDLVDATVRVPGWSKEPGRDAVARVSMAPMANDGLSIHSFAVSGDGLVASGSLDRADDGSIRRLQIARLILGDTSLSGTVTWGRDDEPHRIDASGPRLDLAHLLDELDRTTGDATPWPMELAARFDEVLMGEGRRFVGAQVVASRGAAAWEEAAASARLPGGGGAAASLRRTGDEYRVLATTSDAGEALRVLGLFGGAQGGEGEVRGVVSGPAGARVVEGTARVGAFRVVGAPALAQILSLASLSGLADALQGQGLSFQGFETAFTYGDGKASLGEGRAWGPSLGVSVDGDFSRRDDTVNLAGTLVPAYTINRVLGAIPLLGEILVGEGVFAVAYRVTGSIGEPLVTINPLSVLTPGFLRGIFFGLPDEQEPPAAEAAPRASDG